MRQVAIKYHSFLFGVKLDAVVVLEELQLRFFCRLEANIGVCRRMSSSRIPRIKREGHLAVVPIPMSSSRIPRIKRDRRKGDGILSPLFWKFAMVFS